MHPLAQRKVILNFIKNKGDLSKPDVLDYDEIDRLIHERGLLHDPLTSHDGIQKALVFLGPGMAAHFQEELGRQLGREQRVVMCGYTCLATDIPDNSAEGIFAKITAPPTILCRALVKALGKWDPKALVPV